MPKILIVDDEPHIRILLEQTLEGLEDEGVEIITAEDGEKALSLIAEDPPQLIFLDIMMPKINGFDVCNKVKNELRIEGVYIVLLTSKGQEFDIERGKCVGADTYMTKPFNPDAIVAKAREVLGL